MTTESHSQPDGKPSALTTPDSGGNLASRGARFSVGPIIRAVGMLALLPLTTRVLSSDSLGLVSTAQVVTNVLIAVAALGLPSAALREYFGSDTHSGDPALARSLSLAAIASTVAAAGLALATGPHWARLFGDLPFTTPLALAVLITIPLSVHAVAQNLLRAEDRPLPFSIAVLTTTLGGHLFGLFLAASGNGTPTEYLTGLAVGVTAGSAVAAVFAGMRGRSITRSELGEGLRLGLPTVPHALGIFLLQMGDRIVIINKGGFGDVGRYQVAYLIGSAGIMLVIAFNAAWTPMILRLPDNEERWESLATTTKQMHQFIGLISAGVVIIAPVLLRIAAPSSYDVDSLVPVLSIVALAAIFYVTFQASSIVLLHVRRTGPLGLTSLVAAGFNLLLNLLLVPRWSLIGAAIATSVSYFAWALAVRLIANREVQVNWSDRALARSMLVVLSSLVLGSVLGSSNASLAVRLTIGTALGFGVLRLARQYR